MEIRMLIHAPELAKATEMRSSRDRIARGTVVNALIATIFLSFEVARNSKIILLGLVFGAVVLLAGLLITLVCVAMWARFQRLSYDYEIQSLSALDEKLSFKRESKDKSL